MSGMKNDFRSMFTENKCPVSCDSTETLQHLLECSVLRQQHVSDNVTASNVRYSDVFSSSITRQKQVTQLYSELLEIRNNLLDSQPESSTRAQAVNLCKSSSILSCNDIYGATFGNKN